MPPSPYTEALLRARARLGALDEATLARIEAATRLYAEALAQRLGGLPMDRRAAVEASEAIIRQTSGELSVLLERIAAQGRDATFEDTLAIWERAGALVAEQSGIPAATLGAVRTVPITLLGAFDAIGSPQTWRTLLRAHVEDAAGEAAAIVRAGIAEGIGPQELSRRLRKYVTGSEPFQRLFAQVQTASGTVAKIDLRKIPAHLRGQASRMQYNAERIAYTELGNARREAEVQHFWEDPFIGSLRWTLAPNRGTQKKPDRCDVYASANLYGLGPGIFPVLKLPAEHPWGRCLPAWARVVTIAGEKPIADVRPGDWVLTHRGRWRRVRATIRSGPATDWLRVRTSDGRSVLLTSEHPLLGADGRWVLARDLSVGTEIVARNVPHDHSDKLLGAALDRGGLGVPVEHEQGPPFCPKVRRLLGVLRALLGRVVPAAVNLNGELPRRDGDVDVVAEDRPERFGRDAQRPELLEHGPFVAAKSLFAVGRLGASDGNLVGAPPAGEQGAVALGAPPSFLLGHLLAPENVGLPHATTGHAPLDKPVHDGAPVHAAALGDLVLADEVNRVPVDDLVAVERLPLKAGGFGPAGRLDAASVQAALDGVALHTEALGDGVDAHPASEQAGEFVVVQVAGLAHVPVVLERYNIEVEEDNSYVAESLVLHNCEAIPVTREGLEVRRAKPNPRMAVTEPREVRVPRATLLTDDALERVRVDALANARLGAKAIDQAIRARAAA